MTGGLSPISLSWHWAPWDSQPDFFFQLNTCSHSPYVTSSLMRGWVCRLQLLLALASAFILRSESLASAFILRSESHRTHDHLLLSQIRDSSNLEPRSPYLHPPGTGWTSYTPQHWGPFPLPFTSHNRATVEVIWTSSTPWRASLPCLDTLIWGGLNTKHSIADFWRSCYMCTPLK
jgi:hypothetical protein